MRAFIILLVLCVCECECECEFLQDLSLSSFNDKTALMYFNRFVILSVCATCVTALLLAQPSHETVMMLAHFFPSKSSPLLPEYQGKIWPLTSTLSQVKARSRGNNDTVAHQWLLFEFLVFLKRTRVNSMKLTSLKHAYIMSFCAMKICSVIIFQAIVSHFR